MDVIQSKALLAVLKQTLHLLRVRTTPQDSDKNTEARAWRPGLRFSIRLSDLLSSTRNWSSLLGIGCRFLAFDWEIERLSQ